VEYTEKLGSSRFGIPRRSNCRMAEPGETPKEKTLFGASIGNDWMYTEQDLDIQMKIPAARRWQPAVVPWTGMFASEIT